jgi:ferredoxin-NADP reductase
VDVRLTAVGGYQAQRSYSIGSAPEEDEIELVIERLDNGEVSAFFHEAAQPGDTIEVRGPIGRHFTWGREDGGPLLLVGGGSGVVPLVSILRHRAAVAPDVPATLVYSARDMQEVIFRDELFSRADMDPPLSVILTLTREQPVDPRIRHGRVNEALFREIIARQGVPANTYACGSTSFVDSATRAIIDAGVDFASIRSERYGGDPKRA